jgi:hypothetical protein
MSARHKWKWSPQCNGRGVCQVCGMKTGVRSYTKDGKYRRDIWFVLKGSKEKLKKMPPCRQTQKVCPHCKGTGVVRM